MPFNVGPVELIIVLVIALLILGPGKLPEVGSAFGKTIREFKKASTDIQDATNVTPATAPAAPVAQAAAPIAPAAAPVAVAPAPVAPAPVAVAPAPNTLSDTVAPNTLTGEVLPKGTPTDAVEERA